MVYVLFIIGFVLLIKGADYLIEGAASFAQRFGISNFVIGMTVVAFGTSAPELVVNIMAGLAGKSDLAVGNILGSNVANILLVPGIAALLFPIVVRRSIVKIDLPMSVVAAIILALLALDFAWLNLYDENILSMFDGLVLIVLFFIFIGYSFKSGKIDTSEEIGELSTDSLLKSGIFVIVGLLGLGIGGNWIVNGAVEIARIFGMSEALIGLTIVAIGTSLPEVAASAMAAKKHNADMAMGNVIGSNIFNILWVLGCSAIINPLEMPYRAMEDIGMVLISSLLVWVLILLPKKFTITKMKGVVCLLAYAGYLVFLVIRG